jgi:hypothetical protein
MGPTGFKLYSPTTACSSACFPRGSSSEGVWLARSSRRSHAASSHSGERHSVGGCRGGGGGDEGGGGGEGGEGG